MFEINCPFCGTREMTEFSCHGQANIVRPLNTHELTDEEWGDYVFFRDNPKGNHYERWIHTHGCRKWFNVMRNTISDEILAVYKIGDPVPPAPNSAQITAGKTKKSAKKD